MRVTDFTALHDAMAEAFKQGIKGVRTVDALSADPPSDGVMTPAIFVGVEELAEARKLTDGRVALTCHFTANCLLSTKSTRPELAILNMAGSVAALVSGNQWGVVPAVSLPKGLSAVPGEFSKGGKGLVCWVVSWEQVIHIGPDWTPDDDDFAGYYVADCHDDRHKLEDLPHVDS